MTDPTTDRLRAIALLEAAGWFEHEGRMVQQLFGHQVAALLRRRADDADPMVGSLARDGFGADEIAAMLRPEGAVVPPPTQPDITTLAAALDGLHTLIATSSRDWATYRVDAWLWAVLCGWDCEQAEHDDTCTHGALEETAAMHGWDADTVAKVRRYRAAVRALTDTAAEAQPATEAPCCSDPTCACIQVTADGRCACARWESSPQQPAAGARQDGARRG